MKENEENTQEETQEETVEEQEEVLNEGEEETPDQESEVVEEGAPSVLPSDRVEEILSETNLPQDARALLSARSYEDEAQVTDAAESLVKILKAVSHSGEPFAQGETRPEDGAPLSPEELEEKKLKRFNRIMREVGATEV